MKKKNYNFYYLALVATIDYYLKKIFVSHQNVFYRNIPEPQPDNASYQVSAPKFPKFLPVVFTRQSGKASWLGAGGIGFKSLPG